ncbi:hypothetical protein WN48_08712 [Eufriesea mexicana]|nr:hypothetical protein WN48_08712 [Eufriesea mexicana]
MFEKEKRRKGKREAEKQWGRMVTKPRIRKNSVNKPVRRQTCIDAVTGMFISLDLFRPL